jgi:hypothetical protein
MSEIKRRSQWIAAKFDNAYPGWLRDRSFIMPGMEMGFRFTGVNIEDDFHQKMSQLVGQFAFSVKSMQPKKESCTEDCIAYYQDFDKYVQRSSQSVSARSSYFREQMGLDELVQYQTSASDPQMGNIVYWGDTGDAMTNVHPRAAQALRQMLGESSGGSFFYAPLADEGMLDAQNGKERTILKSILWYDRAQDKIVRQQDKYGLWEDSVGVYDQWNRWSQSDPEYSAGSSVESRMEFFASRAYCIQSPAFAPLFLASTIAITSSS